MAVPKRRTSKKVKRLRQSTKGLVLPNLVVCKQCGKKIITHRVCKFCGSYNNEKVL